MPSNTHFYFELISTPSTLTDTLTYINANFKLLSNTYVSKVFLVYIFASNIILSLIKLEIFGGHWKNNVLLKN